VLELWLNRIVNFFFLATVRRSHGFFAPCPMPGVSVDRAIIKWYGKDAESLKDRQGTALTSNQKNCRACRIDGQGNGTTATERETLIR
jgi:hypothetical protein